MFWFVMATDLAFPTIVSLQGSENLEISDTKPNMSTSSDEDSFIDEPHVVSSLKRNSAPLSISSVFFLCPPHHVTSRATQNEPAVTNFQQIDQQKTCRNSMATNATETVQSIKANRLISESNQRDKVISRRAKNAPRMTTPVAVFRRSCSVFEKSDATRGFLAVPSRLHPLMRLNSSFSAHKDTAICQFGSAIGDTRVVGGTDAASRPSLW